MDRSTIAGSADVPSAPGATVLLTEPGATKHLALMEFIWGTRTARPDWARSAKPCQSRRICIWGGRMGRPRSQD